MIMYGYVKLNYQRINPSVVSNVHTCQTRLQQCRCTGEDHRPRRVHLFGWFHRTEGVSCVESLFHHWFCTVFMMFIRGKMWFYDVFFGGANISFWWVLWCLLLLNLECGWNVRWLIWSYWGPSEDGNHRIGVENQKLEMCGENPYPDPRSTTFL